MKSKLLDTLKFDLTMAMKIEIGLKKDGITEEKLKSDPSGCIAQKEVSRAIISMLPEIGVKSNEATDDDILKLLKKFVANEKERELYQQRLIVKDDVKDLSVSEVKKLVNSKIQEMGKSLTSKRIEMAEKYLPKQASEEEITRWIKNNIDFSQYKNKMQAMGPVMKRFKGSDGHFVRNILSKL